MWERICRFSTDVPHLKPLHDDVDPCAIDKAQSVALRRYGGLLGWHSMRLGSAGGRRVLDRSMRCSLGCISRGAPRYMLYDTACALRRFARHHRRALKHHVCTNPEHALFMPEVIRETHAELRGVNTHTCEVMKMAPATYKVFLLIICHWYNNMVMGVSDRGVRPRFRQPRSNSNAALPRDVPATQDRAPAAKSEDPVPRAARQVRLFRNPNGVGTFGASKLHWDEDASSLRPSCRGVLKPSLPHSVHVAVKDIEYLQHFGFGFAVHLPADRGEVCTICARALLSSRGGGNGA